VVTAETVGRYHFRIRNDILMAIRNEGIILATKAEDMDMKFNVVLTPAEEGGYNVSVPALEGCFTQGETEEEALENAKEAILCYLEGLEKLNEIKAQPGVSLKEVEVTL
jgi:predicted RNase H-like HicB family nuclease